MKDDVSAYTMQKAGETTNVAEIKNIYREQLAYREIARHSSVDYRISKIKQILEVVEKYKEDLASAFHKQFGKPQTEVELTEVYPFIKECHQIIKNIKDWIKPLAVRAPLTYLGTRSKIIREPKGNTLIISPWNYPFNLTFIPLVSSFAAGNTVIVKPSEHTPFINKVMRNIVEQVFERSEVAMIEGDEEVAGVLLKHRFDHIHFTGSTKVGQIVMKAAADFHSSITLEMGGKSPAIVDNTADLDKAAKRIVWGKYLNNGQTCIAPDYILVQTECFDKLLELIIAAIKEQFGQDIEAIRASSDLCRIINRKHYDRLSYLIDEAVEKGSRVAFGNDRKEEENYISPTVLLDIDHESQIMNEEIFGPVLPLIHYRTNKEALDWIKSRNKPLSMYIFSRDKKNISELMDSTSAGTTCINHCVIHYSHPDLPFGGVNHSGIGKSHGKWAFDEFTYERAVLHQKFFFSPSDLLRPPYNKTVKFFVDMLQKWF